MLIAVLADIHGNLEALRAVWADMAPHSVDEIVSLGDMVGYGPDPDEVLTELRGRKVRCCLGNHELGIVSARERSWFNPTARKGLDLTRDLISDENRAYIATLPRFLQVAGARFVHGFPPDNVTTYLFLVDDLRLAAWFGSGEGRTFVGHTHELAHVVWNGAEVERRELRRGSVALCNGPCIVNAGSVGQPRDGDNTAKYLLWDTEQDTVEVRFVPYDIARTAARILERGFPEYYATRLW